MEPEDSRLDLDRPVVVDIQLVDLVALELPERFVEAVVVAATISRNKKILPFSYKLIVFKNQNSTCCCSCA